MNRDSVLKCAKLLLITLPCPLYMGEHLWKTNTIQLSFFFEFGRFDDMERILGICWKKGAIYYVPHTSIL